MPEITFALRSRMRNVLRYASYVVLALVVFVFALQLTFPFARATDKAIGDLAGYDITIGSIERGWIPGRVYYNALTIRNRPTRPEEVVTTFYIERLQVDLGLFALLGKTLSVDVHAKIGAGHLDASLDVAHFGRGSVSARVDGEALPGANLPLRALLGLPMTGKLELHGDLDLPVEKLASGRVGIDWPKAALNLELSCPSGCTFGDGKTKLKPLLKDSRQQVMVGDGIEFGMVNLDSLVAAVEMKAGKLEVKKFDVKSPDGQLELDYAMTIAPELGDSQVAGCLRFKASNHLLEREPKTFAAIQTMGAELHGDGLFHIRLSDRFKEMKRYNKECGPNAKAPGGEVHARRGPT